MNLRASAGVLASQGLHYVTILALLSAALMLLVVARLSFAMRKRQALSEEVRQLEKELYFKVLAANSADVILVVGADGIVRRVGPTAGGLFAGRDLTGRRLDSLFGESQAARLLAAMIGPEALHALDSGQAIIAARHSSLQWPMNLRLLSPAGAETDIEARCDDLREYPSVGGFVLTLRDVTEQRRLERELRHLAFHDPLTGLANRRRLDEQLDEALTAVSLTGGVAGVVVLDMDDFKEVNDRYGHAVGDEVIAAIGARLTANVRDDDLVARLGGDEFAVVLGPGQDLAQLEVTARRLAALFDTPFEVSVGELGSTASVGLATTADGSPDEHLSGREILDPEVLLHRADLAHYAVKQSGKHGVRRYDLGLGDTAATLVDDGDSAHAAVGDSDNSSTNPTSSGNSTSSTSSDITGRDAGNQPSGGTRLHCLTWPAARW